MSYAVQFRRGTTAEHASFTGAAGEITVNTTTNQLIVHDGVTVGGHVVGSGGGAGGASTLTDLNISDGTDGQVLTTDGAGTFTFTTLSNSGGSGGGDISSIISPSAFAYVNTTSDGSGTNISWSNWNGAYGTMDFTFATAQTDVNYAVISDVEGFDDINIQVSSKSTTGFTVTIYNDSGNVGNPSTTAAFSIMVYSSVPSASSSANTSSTEILADMPALIAKTGMSTGDQVYLTSNNNLYLYIGTGWYLIATVQNNAPSAITNVNSSYDLSMDGTPTVITAVATDPEGFPLTWSYAVTSGSLGATTISQTDNVFTITPSTNSVDSGEFTLTISATDGTNGAVNTITSMLLQFSVVNSRNTTLLLTAVGASDNSNVTDSSTNNHTVAAYGDAFANTFSPYRAGGYSMYFDGSGSDWVKSDTHADFGFGTDDFTIECWYYPVSKLQSYPRIWNFGPFWQNSQSLAFVDRHNDNNTVLTLNSWTAGEILRSTTTIENSKWYHLTVERSGTTITLYVNGVSEDTYDAGTSEFITSSPSYVTIGNVSDGSNLYESALQGNIKDFRYVKGTAVYGANFTPPTQPLTEVTNTKLLTAQGLQISDVSANNHSMSKTGDVLFLPTSPYDYSEYNSTSHGGSVYFDGSGDYLDLDFAAIGTSDYTIECWIYVTSSSSNELICDFRPTGSDNSTGIWMYLSSSNKLVVGTGGAVYITGTSAYPDNQWVHVSVQRVGGLLTLYGNGILQGTKSNVSTNLTSTDMRVGTNRTAASVYHGYISDFKLVKSALRVDANGSHLPYFDLPTEPSDSTGTEIHIKGTDASIIDKTQNKTILTLEGNTTGSTTQVKFANSKSIYFDGNGDYITAAANSSILGDGDFTVETWIYANSIDSAYRCICSQGGGGNSFRMFLKGTQIQVWRGASPMIDYENSTVGNTWYHIAYSDDTLYVNGQSVTTIPTPGFDRTLTSISIGGNDNGSINGYMADFRITNGLARYTANFTPPTSSLKG
jgi:hypothetical protein